MDIRFRSKSILVMGVTIVVLLAAGLVYALQIERDLPGTLVIGEVRTSADTILLYSRIDPSTADLAEITFGTHDMDVFGFFVTRPKVQFWVANGGGIPFNLTAVASNVVLHRSGTGDRALPGDALGLLMGGPDEELVPSPAHATLIRPGDVPISLEAGLRLQGTPQELGILQGDTLTFTVLFKAVAVDVSADIYDLFPVAPDRDLYELARSLLRKCGEPLPRVVNVNPVSYEEGRQDTFWLTDILAPRAYTISATLRLVSPHAYWYVEEGVDISQIDLEKAADAFEADIYLNVTMVFGTEWIPGVENDPHLTILHARLRGVAGYYSSVDEYPVCVHQHSNQREMVYMHSGLVPGSGAYLSVLAHELQHAIHWNGDPTEETWVNEGLSELAKTLAGFEASSQIAFLGSPTISLVDWPIGPGTLPYYGADFLFFDYLSSHYGTRNDLIRLVGELEDGIRGINAYLAGLDLDVTFEDVFKDWVVANYLDQPGAGTYSYPDRNVRVRDVKRMGDFGARQSSIPQYSAEYIVIDIATGDIRVRFQGQNENILLPTSLDGGRCWWSNRGDSISSTLTRALDLSGVDRATLEYRVWFDVEEDWDYGYLEVSTDGGDTWDVLAAPAHHQPIPWATATDRATPEGEAGSQ